MTRLLDTHALLWWLDGDTKLSKRVRTLIEHGREKVHVSAASAWEISTKARIGKLPLAPAVARRLPDVLEEQGFPLLPVTVRHGHEAGWLQGEHRDPFDRILAAQAIAENFVLLTTDRKLAELGARVLW